VRLSTGGIATVDERRVRIDLPPIHVAKTTSSSCPTASYNAISSAVLNGGCQTFSPSSSSTSTHYSLRVINYRVPSTYDGISPDPQTLLKDFAAQEAAPHDGKVDVIGLLTAASMNTFATATRSAQDIHVDVIVTAGLSNSRAAGADADYFALEDEGSDEKRLGTINTVVITDASLTPAALVEAYAIAIEAKCGACADMGVCCAKNPTSLAQGTGTDCCVFLSPSGKGKDCNVVKHVGKHTLFAEMVGQAVREATSEAIMINIRHLYGNYAIYTIRRWARKFAAASKGARPCIPPRPMMPIPSASLSVVLMGISSVSLAYCMPLPGRARLLLGAVAWDRYLGEPPLRWHPVCLAGSTISFVLSRTPEKVFQNPLLGFGYGLLLLVSMIGIFISVAILFLEGTNMAAAYGTKCISNICTACSDTVTAQIFDFMAWILKLLLLKSTLSIQLLCTVSLQMGKFIERKQIDEARAQLSWLCSRDPSKLGIGELSGATLESLSENLSDGFVAPLFWYVILGPVGALGYRVVNTLDSRVGYRGKFEWFGKPSARLDDVLNLIPARITAVLLAAAAVFVSGCSARDGLITAWRDCSQCRSPNAGWPMACMAGLLRVRLEKSGEYCLGSHNAPDANSIRSGHSVAQLAAGMTLLIAIIATSVVTPML